jgi:hypothetical protein
MPPDIGKYNPRMESVDKKTPGAQIPKEPTNQENAKLKKMEFDFNNSSICGHIVKNIANWHSEKKKAPIPPTPGKEL